MPILFSNLPLVCCICALLAFLTFAPATIPPTCANNPPGLLTPLSHHTVCSPLLDDDDEPLFFSPYDPWSFARLNTLRPNQHPEAIRLHRLQPPRLRRRPQHHHHPFRRCESSAQPPRSRHCLVRKDKGVSTRSVKMRPTF